jgi:phage gpG-like protein
MIKKVGDFDFDKKIASLKRAKVKLPAKIGNEAKNHFIAGFRKDGGGGQTDASIGGWKKRKFPRITPTGMISKSKNAGILTKSGALRRSIRVVQRTWNRIKIASNLPYSEIQNEGGHITQVVTAKQAAYLGHMGANLKKRGNTLLGNAYSRMANAPILNIDIPKREFIGNSRILNKKIKKLINREFLLILKR